MEVYGPDIYKVHRRHFDIAKAGRTSEFEFYEIRDGLQFHFAAIYVPQFDDNAQVVGVCSMINDITRSKQIEQELIRLARYDTLTGLPNRNQLNERLPEVIARCARMGLTAAVLYLDIDKFKQINDSMGHYAGDLVLQEFARRLLTAVRTTDMVVRLAGDEFVIVLEALENVDVSVVTEKILRSMDAPFVIEGSQRKVKASIGAVTFSDGQHDVSVILKKADEALYMAKAAGRNTAIILDLSSA
jgi:diguanylate cyclase (GGDEF)-like protein